MKIIEFLVLDKMLLKLITFHEKCDLNSFWIINRDKVVLRPAVNTINVVIVTFIADGCSIMLF